MAKNRLSLGVDLKEAIAQMDDAPDAVQDWITGDGKPRIYNPYA